MPAARLTRAEVADYFGVSTSTVRRLEGTRLHPRFDKKRGCFLFDSREVLALDLRVRPVRERTIEERWAKLAARAFDMFDEGATLPDVVRRLRLTPERVRSLHAEYITPLPKKERANGKR